MEGYEIAEVDGLPSPDAVVRITKHGVHKTCISKRSKPYAIKKCKCGSGLTFKQCCMRG